MKPTIITYTLDDTVNGRDFLTNLVCFCHGAQAANPDAIDFTYNTAPPKITIHTAHVRFYDSLLIQFGPPTSIVPV